MIFKLHKPIIYVGLLMTALSLSYSKPVKAATITLPVKSGYTKTNLRRDANNDNVAFYKLQHASIKGMKENNYVDHAKKDKRTINLKHLSAKDKKELTKFTLNTINNARKQLHLTKWTYSTRAQRFANSIAHEYTINNRSCWDSDHYFAGIRRAAIKHGLQPGTLHAQMYEDESGLPVTNSNTQKTTMKEAKEKLYFNLKQMYFGGFYGNKEDYNNLSRYTEFNHARDLLTGYQWSPKTKLYGMSFSTLNDPTKVSVHFVGVDKHLIRNYKKF